MPCPRGISKNKAMIKDAVSSFLKSYHWDYFLTVTPRRPRKDAIAFMRDVWDELKPPSEAIMRLSGDWSHDKATRAFLACEPFFLEGNLHVHGIMAGTSDVNLPWWFNEGLNQRFGRSQVSLCRSEEQVSAYCAKYVSKRMGGDNYDFFGDW